MIAANIGTLFNTCVESSKNLQGNYTAHIPKRCSSASAEFISLSSAIETNFKKYADRWERDTVNMSSPTTIESHADYVSIIKLGRSVIPLILERMQDRPNFWFKALELLTGVQPVNPKNWGNIRAMTDDWLKWSERSGYSKSRGFFQDIPQTPTLSSKFKPTSKATPLDGNNGIPYN